MEEFNFDEIVNRENTNSSKYDEAFDLYKRKDLDILSVADMEFKTADCIKNAIIDKVNKGILGYTSRPKKYFESYVTWYEKNYDFKFDVDCMVHCPGVISGMRVVIETFTKEHDKILIFEPVYASFKRIVGNTNRDIVISKLKNENGKFVIDFDDFYRKIRDVKVAIICNPHNPLGRSWTSEELKKIANICREYNVLVISDEIHADLTLFNNKHYVFRQYYENTITFISSTKTFNLSGIQASVCVLRNKEEASIYFDEWRKKDIYRPNAIAIEAIMAAHSGATLWLDNLKKYIEQNLLFIDEFLKENLPNVKFFIPEATYLCFIDLRSLGIPEKQMQDILMNKANLVVVMGSVFGESGQGYIRLNAACSRTKLERVLKNMLKALG